MAEHIIVDTNLSGEAVVREPDRDRIAKEIKKKGLVQWIKEILDLPIAGEDKTKVILWLVASSRHLDKPLHAILEGKPATGKSWLIHWAVKESHFQEDIFYRTRITPKVLERLGDKIPKGSIFIIEQLGGLEASDQVKVAMTENELILETLVKDQNNRFIPETVKADLKFSFISGTVKPVKDQELSSRVFRLETDDSPEQTKRVIEHQARLEANPWLIEYFKECMEDLIFLDKLLKRSQVKKVKIPFAQKVLKELPEFIYLNPESRRVIQRAFGLTEVISLIKYVLGLRKTEEFRGEKYIIAEEEDFEEAKKLIDLSRLGSGLTSKEEEVLKAVFKLTDEEERPAVKISELMEELHLGRTTLWRICRSLVAKSYLDCTTRKGIGFYSLTPLAEQYLLEKYEVNELVPEKEAVEFSRAFQKNAKASIEQKEEKAESPESFSPFQEGIQKDAITCTSGKGEKVEKEEAEASIEQKEAEGFFWKTKENAKTSVSRKCGNCRHYDQVRKTCKKYSMHLRPLPPDTDASVCSGFEPKEG